jgi:DNA repair photolyase
MKMLLYKNIGVQFVTKGKIPGRFLELFSKYRNIVSGQIGIAYLEDRIRKILEPGTTSVANRFKNIKALTLLDIDVTVRADPLIHGLTDSQTQIEELCSEIANTGAKQLAVSYLFLRPAIKKSLESNISDKNLLTKIIDSYKTGSKIKIGTGNSAGVALPADIRNQLYEHIRKIARQFGISVHICGCKNNDITSESCRITKPQSSDQIGLF